MDFSGLDCSSPQPQSNNIANQTYLHTIGPFPVKIFACKTNEMSSYLKWHHKKPFSFFLSHFEVISIIYDVGIKVFSSVAQSLVKMLSRFSKTLN